MKRNKEFYEGVKFYDHNKESDLEKDCPYSFQTEQALDWMEGFGAAEDNAQLESEIENLTPEQVDELIEENHE